MATPQILKPKRAPQPIELRYLRLLMWATAHQCVSNGCKLRACRRSGGCRALAQIERRFVHPDGFDSETSYRLVDDMRNAFRAAGWPPLCPGARRDGETLQSAVKRWIDGHMKPLPET